MEMKYDSSPAGGSVSIVNSQQFYNLIIIFSSTSGIGDEMRHLCLLNNEPAANLTEAAIPTRVVYCIVILHQ